MVIELAQRVARRGVTSLATVAAMAAGWGTAGTCCEVVKALQTIRPTASIAPFFNRPFS